MDAVGCRDAVLASEQIAHRHEVAAGICSGSGDLGCSVESGSAANDDCADGAALYKSRQTDGCVAREIEGPARKAQGGLIDNGRGHQMRLTQADYLFPQRHQGRTEGIGRWSVRRAVIHGVNSGQRIFV